MSSSLNQYASMDKKPQPEENLSDVIEYIVVADKTSAVLASNTDYNVVLKTAQLIRKGGGEVTIFRALKA